MDLDLVINPDWSQRRQNRCAAFRYLFQWEMNPAENLSEDLNEYLERLEGDDEFFTYAIQLVDGIIEKLGVIDSIIKDLVDNWEFSRIAKIDLALLRVAIFEIKYRLDVPPIVIINETLEISKDFSSENSRKFLNGVLDKSMEQMNRPTRKPSI